MLMIQPPLDMGFEAYRHAVVHVQRLSENARHAETESSYLASWVISEQEALPERDAVPEKVRAALNAILEGAKNSNEISLAFINHVKSAELIPYHSLWHLDNVWNYNLKLEVPDYSTVFEVLELIGDSAQGTAIINKAIELQKQAVDLNAKVGRMIKRSLEAHEKRKRIVLPKTEAEMDRRAERFAKQNRKVISELSRI